MSNSVIGDPRRRPAANDPRKRQSSHSPEPQRPHKHHRPSHGNGNSSPRDTGSSRRSSISNGATPSEALPGNRRPASTQLKADAPRQHDGPSPGSPFHGSGSGRSTPQHTNTGESAKAVGRQTTKDADAPAPSPVLNALQSFSSQVATQASLEISCRQASQAYKRADAEYKSLRSNFRNFPALQEKKTSAREHAYQSMQQAKQDLEKHANAQKTAMEGLAALIGSGPNAKPEAETRTDLASREEVTALREKHVEMTREFNSKSTTLNTMHGRLNAIEQNAIDAAKEAKKFAVETSKSIREIKASADDALKLSKEAKAASEKGTGGDTASVEAVRQSLASFKTEASAQYALKQDVGQLESKQEVLAQDVAGIRRTSTACLKEIEQVKSSRATQNSKSASDAVDSEYRSRVDQMGKHEIWEGWPKLAQRVSNVEQKTAMIQALTIGADAKAFDHDSLLSWVVGLQNEFQETQDELSELSKENNELGKGTVKERLKKLDRVVNNLSTQIGGDGKTTIQQTINALEKKLEELRQSVELVKNAPAIVAPSQDSVEDGELRSQQPEFYRSGHQGSLVARVPDLENKYDALRADVEDLKNNTAKVDPLSDNANEMSDISDRVDKIEEELRSLVAQQDDKDEIIFKEVESNNAAQTAALEDKSKETNAELAKFGDLLAEVKSSHHKLEGSVQAAVSNEAFGQYQASTIQPIRDDVTKLQTQFRDLQAQKARQTSMSAPQAPPAFAQSPQMPNGINSPQLNGPQRVPTPQGQPGPDTNRMQSQIDGLIMAQQHLKQRCDNLVTDDIVKAMADQMGTMYPEAKNFSSATKALSKRADALEGEVRNLKQSAASRPAEMHALRTRVDKIDEAVKEADRLAKRMEQDLVGVKHTASTLSKAQTKSPAPESKPAVTPAELATLRTQVEETAKVAREADVLSRGHSTRFDKLNLTKKRMAELADMEGLVRQQTGRMDRVELTCKSMEKDVEGLAMATAKNSAAVKKIEEARKS